MRRHIAFRDYLRVNLAEAQAYAQIKRPSAERFRHDRVAYTDAKSEFVRAVLGKTLSREGTAPH